MKTQKQKGNENERNLAKWFERWTGEKFARVPASGGLRWQNKDSVVGDVVTQDETFYFPFTIETKHVQNAGIVKGKTEITAKYNLFQYWQQAETDTARLNTSEGKPTKVTLLLVRQNRMPKDTWYFFVDRKLKSILRRLGLEFAHYATKASTTIFAAKSDEVLKIDFKKFRCEVQQLLK